MHQVLIGLFKKTIILLVNVFFPSHAVLHQQKSNFRGGGRYYILMKDYESKLFSSASILLAA